MRRGTARGWWLAALAVAGLALILVLLARGPLARALFPEAEAETLRREAEAALARGVLTSPDGRGARELYEAAIAIDPDRAQLRSGLAAVARAAVRDASAAVDAGDLPRARVRLDLARALAAPRDEVAAVAARVQAREADRAGVDAMLARAEAARAAGRLDGAADAALPLYARVLALQPARTQALEGREDALSVLLGKAREAVARGDVAAAGALVAAARRYDAGHVDIPDAEEALAVAVDRVRRRAEASFASGDLALAADAALAWRASGVDVEAADALCQRIAGRHAEQARRAAADFEFRAARAALARAEALAPDAPPVVDARRALLRAEAAERRYPLDPDPRRARARITALLAQSAAAEARGDWLTPPGDSAFDALRAAMALAPRDARVVAAQARLVPRARDCVDAALRENRLRLARECLDAQVALGDSAPRVAEARRRLAARWVGLAEEHLRAGRVTPAREAVDEARALDARVPGLDAIDAQVTAAEAAR